MYERRESPPVSRSAFLWRLAGHVGVAGCLAGGSLLAGMAGYHHYEHLSWRDAFLNAAMLLGGEGPVETPATASGKLFAGWYALYSGLVFVVIAGILLAPIGHRLLHKFHWEADDDPDASAESVPKLGGPKGRRR